MCGILFSCHFKFLPYSSPPCGELGIASPPHPAVWPSSISLGFWLMMNTCKIIKTMETESRLFPWLLYTLVPSRWPFYTTQSQCLYHLALFYPVWKGSLLLTIQSLEGQWRIIHTSPMACTYLLSFLTPSLEPLLNSFHMNLCASFLISNTPNDTRNSFFCPATTILSFWIIVVILNIC